MNLAVKLVKTKKRDIGELRVLSPCTCLCTLTREKSTFRLQIRPARHKPAAKSDAQAGVHQVPIIHRFYRLISDYPPIL